MSNSHLGSRFRCERSACVSLFVVPYLDSRRVVMTSNSPVTQNLTYILQVSFSFINNTAIIGSAMLVNDVVQCSFVRSGNMTFSLEETFKSDNFYYRLVFATTHTHTFYVCRDSTTHNRYKRLLYTETVNQSDFHCMIYMLYVRLFCTWSVQW